MLSTMWQKVQYLMHVFTEVAFAGYPVQTLQITFLIPTHVKASDHGHL